MPSLYTTLGELGESDLGIILPHEHVFVDLRTCDQPGYGQAAVEDVIALMAPELHKARAAGVTALVDCGPIGVGRRVDILKAVSQAANFPLVAPTGVYREPWMPPWVHEASEDQLAEWMRAELQDEIVENGVATGVKAGFIKLSAGDDGITPGEARVLRAAARAAHGAVIGSHTIRGRVVRDQLNILEEAGYPASRFIWIHTQAEPDFNLHLEMARRGAWLEYDSIGSPEDDAKFIDWILRLLDAGFENQLLLSHDRGWYDPAKPGGGVPQPFTYLTEQFLPRLREAGATANLIEKLVRRNPFRAFSR